MNSKVVLIRTLVISEAVSLLFLAGCGGSTASALNDQPRTPVSNPPASPTGVAVSPTNATVQAGGEQQFTATVSPTRSNQAVTWSVSGASCTGTTCGTIDTTGEYTAPATVPNPPTVVVTARSVADSTKAATAAVTIISDAANPNNAKLSGQYAFLFSGFNNAGPMSVVGSFTADGNGNLIAGNTDVTVFRSTKMNQGLTSSIYSVASDNSGTMNLNTAVKFPSGGFSFTFSFALDSFDASGVAGTGRLIESEGTDQTGTGLFVKQDPTAFSTAATSGGFAFGLAGPDGIYEDVALGRFTASDGSLSAGRIDSVGFGIANETDAAFTGTYSVDASGRGTAALDISDGSNPLRLIFYVVSSSQSLWMESGGSAATGAALQQSGGPFTVGSLSGRAVFGAAGFGVAGNDVTVGEVQFDGAGNVTGTNDENYFGLSFSDEPITGIYTVDPNGLGRGAISETSGPGLGMFYLVSPSRGFIISGNDSLEFGTFEPQSAGPLSNASFSGHYAFGGPLLLSTVATSFASGVLSADGAGDLSGTLTTKAGTQTFTGTYFVATNGRTTLFITATAAEASNLVFYFVSPSKAVGVQVTDFGPADAMVNVIEK